MKAVNFFRYKQLQRQLFGGAKFLQLTPEIEGSAEYKEYETLSKEYITMLREYKTVHLTHVEPEMVIEAVN
jgi:hypothetical protein